jgi:hypothetical protein
VTKLDVSSVVSLDQLVRFDWSVGSVLSEQLIYTRTHTSPRVMEPKVQPASPPLS